MRVVKQCLQSIEGDSSLSDAIISELNTAKQQLNSCLKPQSQEAIGADSEKARNWLQQNALLTRLELNRYLNNQADAVLI